MHDLRNELIALKESVWRDAPDKKVLGKPLHAPDKFIDPNSDDIVKVCEKFVAITFRKRSNVDEPVGR